MAFNFINIPTALFAGAKFRVNTDTLKAKADSVSASVAQMINDGNDRKPVAGISDGSVGNCRCIRTGGNSECIPSAGSFFRCDCIRRAYGKDDMAD